MTLALGQAANCAAPQWVMIRPARQPGYPAEAECGHLKAGDFSGDVAKW
jgi:hypothetical protein